MTECVAVLITAGSEAEAVTIARGLVEGRLAACANILGPVRSIYRWQGKVEDAPEILMVVKTRREHFGELMTRVKELHSYAVPEIIALPIVEGSADYLGWLVQETAWGDCDALDSLR